MSPTNSTASGVGAGACVQLSATVHTSCFQGACDPGGRRSMRSQTSPVAGRSRTPTSLPDGPLTPRNRDGTLGTSSPRIFSPNRSTRRTAYILSTNQRSPFSIHCHVPPLLQGLFLFATAYASACLARDFGALSRRRDRAATHFAHQDGSDRLPATNESLAAHLCSLEPRQCTCQRRKGRMRTGSPPRWRRFPACATLKGPSSALTPRGPPLFPSLFPS